MTTSEKMDYLKGIVENIKADGKEGDDPSLELAKLKKVFVEFLNIMSETTSKYEKRIAHIEETISMIDEELGVICEGLDDMEEEIGEIQEVIFSDEDDDEDEGEKGLYELTCPNCLLPVTVDFETIEKGITKCPSCEETIHFNSDNFSENE